MKKLANFLFQLNLKRTFQGWILGPNLIFDVSFANQFIFYSRSCYRDNWVINLLYQKQRNISKQVQLKVVLLAIFSLLQLLLRIPEGGRIPLHVLGNTDHSVHSWDYKNLIVLYGIPDWSVLLPMVWHGSLNQTIEESFETVSGLVYFVYTSTVNSRRSISYSRIYVIIKYAYIIRSFCSWGILLGYNYFVLICKCALQVSCI